MSVNRTSADILRNPPAAPRLTEGDGSVFVRVGRGLVEQMRGDGIVGPFSRIRLDETGAEPQARDAAGCVIDTVVTFRAGGQ